MSGRGITDQLEGLDEVSPVERRHRSEESILNRSWYRASAPAGVERLLDVLGQAPQRHRSGWIEHLGAAISRDGEDRAGLREMMPPRQPSPYGGPTLRTQLAACVPPLGSVHLAYSAYRNAEPALKIDGVRRHQASGMFGSSGPPATLRVKLC